MYIRDFINREAEIMSPTTTVLEAAEALNHSHANGLSVVDKNGILAGIFTKNHLIEAVTKSNFLTLTIGELMDKQIFSLNESLTVKEAQPNNWLYIHDLIPVVDNANHPMGILNKMDLMRYLSDEATFLAGENLAIIDSTCNGVIAMNEEGTITLFNRAAENITGIKVTDAIGEFIDDIVPNSALLRVVETGIGEINQQQIIGSCKILTNRSPIIKSSKILGAVAVFQNITELQAVATELENVKDLKNTLESVIESVFEGVVVVDNNAIITMINQAYCDFLGTDRKRAIGKPVTDVIPNTRMHIVVQNHKAEIGEVQRIGSNNVVVTRTLIVKDGQITGAVGKVLFKDVKDLRIMATRFNKLQSELEYYKEELRKVYGSKYTIESIISSNEKMKWLKSIVLKAAKGHATVLLLGESGTGKELFAHAIHNASPKKHGPFIKVNCAAIPENLLESELFGYAEGAFTGARKGGKPGKFELANGGSIFLDEIGDMPMVMQVKLLRVLQEKEIERIGGTKTISIDVRVISATNKDLEQLVKRGTFRLDLYYRLNIISLSIPPLRERYDDVPLLCNVLLQKISKNINCPLRRISPAVMKMFIQYSWPGNVRELENVLERAVNLMDDEEFILPEHLPPTLKKATSGMKKQTSNIYSVLEDAERQEICKALEVTGGNKSKAAQLLGLHRSGFYTRLRKYNIQP